MFWEKGFGVGFFGLGDRFVRKGGLYEYRCEVGMSMGGLRNV